MYKYLAGHLGGNSRWSHRLNRTSLDLLIFLKDPLNPKHHEPDVHKAVQLCDMHNIPLATNVATAEY